jgi:hypothetical protein
MFFTFLYRFQNKEERFLTGSILPTNQKPRHKCFLEFASSAPTPAGTPGPTPAPISFPTISAGTPEPTAAPTPAPITAGTLICSETSKIRDAK